MYLITSNLDAMGLTTSLIIQKLRYSVSVHMKNYFSAFTFNPSSTSFYKTFSRDFRWYVKAFWVISSILYIAEALDTI